MADLIVLGSAASVPDADHDTVSLVLRGREGSILIDCGGSPLHKLARLGIEMEDVHAVLLTHRHADHIYGLPMLIQGLWQGGREPPLPVYGPQQALDRAQKLLELFELSVREGMFALEWRPVPLRQGRRVLVLGKLEISAAPVVHAGNDTLALRLEDTATGRAIVYSADTEPCPSLIQLAAGADLLLHEATGDHLGHSSPAQAAEVAREAGVAQLVLIHYPVRGLDLEAWRRRAAGFPGPVSLARDGDAYPL
jgi:ribonuclease Z